MRHIEPPGLRRSRSLGESKGARDITDLPSLGLRPSGVFGLSLSLRFTATDSFSRPIPD